MYLEDNEVGYRTSIVDIGWKSALPDLLLEIAQVVGGKAGCCRCLVRADHMEKRALGEAFRKPCCCQKVGWRWKLKGKYLCGN